MNKQLFKDSILKGYSCQGDFITLGGAMIDGICQKDTLVNIPLKTLNRHGLIAGATGTGKSKTLQIVSEQLSLKGVPVLLMDVKGDLSGLAKAGEEKSFITERHSKIGIPYHAESMPVELLSISNDKGIKLRATVTEFGPVLFSKILELNDVQSGIISLIFKYSDDHQLPLLDLKDLKKLLQFVINDGKETIKEEYGAVSSASVNTIIRKIIELEQQGAELFFGEPSFEVNDLLRTDNQGRGNISILRLTDIQDKPKLFSSFMLSLLAEIYTNFPEAGDMEKPKLVLFIDEAHLVFKEASRVLLDQIEAIIKLIRSKGVGVFFCTQNPTDIPNVVLSQLGLKIQHALRAFTARDRKEIKQTAENYPISEFYKTDIVLTSLGIGEALITALNEKGIPTPLVATYMQAPKSRMDILSSEEINDLLKRSNLFTKYEQTIDRTSAYEILKSKIEASQDKEHQRKLNEDIEKSKKIKSEREDPTVIETLSKNTMVRQVGRTLVRELARGLMGALGVSTTSRKRYSKKR
ncbi:helicase HerA-like domain-containing protein [Bacteroidota bacterium]